MVKKVIQKIDFFFAGYQNLCEPGMATIIAVPTADDCVKMTR